VGQAGGTKSPLASLACLNTIPSLLPYKTSPRTYLQNSAARDATPRLSHNGIVAALNGCGGGASGIHLQPASSACARRRNGRGAGRAFGRRRCRRCDARWAAGRGGTAVEGRDANAKALYSGMAPASYVPPSPGAHLRLPSHSSFFIITIICYLQQPPLYLATSRSRGVVAPSSGVAPGGVPFTRGPAASLALRLRKRVRRVSALFFATPANSACGAFLSALPSALRRCLL